MQVTIDPTDLVLTLFSVIAVIIIFCGWVAFKLPELKAMRFSTRDLLIATTLVAVALGIAASVLRLW